MAGTKNIVQILSAMIDRQPFEKDELRPLHDSGSHKVSLDPLHPDALNAQYVFPIVLQGVMYYVFIF